MSVMRSSDGLEDELTRSSASSAPFIFGIMAFSLSLFLCPHDRSQLILRRMSVLRALPIRDTPVRKHRTGCGDDFLFERMIGRGDFIDLDPKTRRLWHRPAMIVELQRMDRADFVEPGHNSNCFLLNDEIGCRHVEVEGHGTSHWPHRIMRADTHMRSFGDRRDSASSGNA